MYKYSTHQVWKSCYLPNHLAGRGEISNTMIFNEFSGLPLFYCHKLCGALNQENIKENTWGFKKSCQTLDLEVKRPQLTNILIKQSLYNHPVTIMLLALSVNRIWHWLIDLLFYTHNNWHNAVPPCWSVTKNVKNN